MNYDAKQLKTALENGCPVFYFYSTEEYLVQAHAQKVLKVLAKEDPDMTRLEGPTPAVEEIPAHRRIWTTPACWRAKSRNILRR